MTQRYVVRGSTFQIKDDLKAFGCEYQGKKKIWVTPSIEKGSLPYKRLKSMAEAVGGNLEPLKLEGQAKVISDILYKER